MGTVGIFPQIILANTLLAAIPYQGAGSRAGLSHRTLYGLY